MSRILLLLMMSMPVQAATWDVTFLGGSNHFGGVVEISPGVEVQPAYNEKNFGLAIGQSFENGYWMTGRYRNSFKNMSNFAAASVGANVGEYQIGPVLGAADGYEDPMLFGALSVRTGGSTIWYHKNLWFLMYRAHFW